MARRCTPPVTSRFAVARVPVRGDTGGVSAEMLVARARRVGVQDERVLEALRAVDRAAFVPAEHRDLAVRDQPVPLPEGQTTSQPSLIARMIEALDLQGHERVLEVGSGYGYQTALLAALAREVVSIERIPALVQAARANLASLISVTVLDGDGSLGAPEHAPYDAIVVSAAFPDVPSPLIEQLAEGGRLVQPVGPGGREEVIVFTRDEQGFRALGRLVGARFVRLYGEHGFPAG